MYQNEKRVEVEKVSQNRMPFLSLTALEMQEKALFREGKKKDQSYALQMHAAEETQIGTDLFSCSRSKGTRVRWRFSD